jgi:hypothetical protein
MLVYVADEYPATHALVGAQALLGVELMAGCLEAVAPRATLKTRKPWWFNRRRTKSYQEAVNGPDGKRYKKRVKITQRPEEEWIAVPVPDSGIPREWIDLAREAIKNNVKVSRNNDRPWVLSGGIARCAECGWTMTVHTVWGAKSRHVNYY